MLFVMGASGRMGGAVVRNAVGPVRAGTRSGASVDGADECVRFDLDNPQTFSAALDGCKAVFVMRPPAVTQRAPFDHLMVAIQTAGVEHIVCASVYGADGSRVLPHRHMEAAVRKTGIPHTFLRPADFMQNLADVHGSSIREQGEIAVPAGNGASAFLDVEDIGHACAAILAAPREHAGRGYDITGPAALTFAEVAEIMTEVLEKPVRYRPMSMIGFLASQLRLGRPLTMSIVMTALYLVQRTGRAAPVCPDFEALTRRAPGTLADYVASERQSFQSGT